MRNNSRKPANAWFRAMIAAIACYPTSAAQMTVRPASCGNIVTHRVTLARSRSCVAPPPMPGAAPDGWVLWLSMARSVLSELSCDQPAHGNPEREPYCSHK